LHLSRIYLYNFRNFPTLQMEPAAGVNLIIGANGSGKTNLLEAIHFLATTRSHRLAKDRYLLRTGEEVFSVHGDLQTAGGLRNLRLDYSGEGKQAFLDGEKTERLSDLVGVLTLSLFSPEDLNFIRGNPAQRRRLIDMWACQLDHNYLEELTDYQNILRQRAGLLRLISGGGNDYQQMEVWDRQLSLHAVQLIAKRRRIIPELSASMSEFCRTLSDAAEEAVLAYKPSFNPREELDNEQMATILQDELKSLWGKDVALCRTTLGPHLDDILFLLDGERANLFASQGQTRLLALSLRLSQHRLLAEKLGDIPLLLLDDVDSELDNQRLQRIITLLPTMGQVFITTTQEELLKIIPNPKTVWKVEKGVIARTG
jgi:DNA replication and repair protein RecF